MYQSMRRRKEGGSTLTPRVEVASSETGQTGPAGAVETVAAGVQKSVRVKL
jgi:hypothetical protein